MLLEGQCEAARGSLLRVVSQYRQTGGMDAYALLLMAAAHIRRRDRRGAREVVAESLHRNLSWAFQAAAHPDDSAAVGEAERRRGLRWQYELARAIVAYAHGEDQQAVAHAKAAAKMQPQAHNRLVMAAALEALAEAAQEG